MKINKVAIAGPDDKTDIDELIRLSKEYPFVEWGILFSKSAAGTQRFPSNEWVAKLFHESKKMNLSAHLCGAYPREVLQNGDHAAMDLFRNFVGRFQINFNFKNTEYKIEHLDYLLDRYKNCIFQYNKSNQEFFETVLPTIGYIRYDVLYDASGGRGTEIKGIPDPFENNYTGYAGGINPDNVESICETIQSKIQNDIVYIDMESGIRTENEFDLEKVEKVLSIAKKYIL